MEKPLKDRRSQTGLTLSEIARTTRIKESYLRAIEEEDFGNLPIEVYTKGYIREYAKFLGLSPKEGLASYDRYIDLSKGGGEKAPAKSSRVATKEQAADSARTQANRFTPERRLSPGTSRESVFKRLLSDKRVAWVLPALLVVLIVYSALPSRKQVTHPTLKIEEPVPLKTEQPIPGSSENTAGPAAGLQPPQGLEIPESPADQAQAAPHRLDIAATDKVWLQVIIDGTEKRDMILNQGDRVSYTAARNFALKIGNAGGLRLVFDQKDLDNLGSKGQVITLRLPDNGSDPSFPMKNNLGHRIVTPSEASQP